MGSIQSIGTGPSRRECMRDKWQHVKYNGAWYVFRGGALLDPQTHSIEIGGDYEPDVILVKDALNSMSCHSL